MFQKLTFFALLCSTVYSVPVPFKPFKRGTFTQLAYADFQISSTPGGTAQAEALAVFDNNPAFAGVDLSTIDSDTLDAIDNMARAAVDAEDVFDSELDTATGSTADALQVGKIKNKVLKLTGEIFVLNIKAAQGQDVATDLATEQTKLNNDVPVDQANNGAASQGVTFTADDPTSSSDDVESTTTTTTATTTTSTTATTTTTSAASATSSATGTGTAFTGTFTQLDYADFQISSTPGGDAQTEALAVFDNNPAFAGVDLSTIPSDVLTAIDNMAKAAVDAEDTFDTELDSATGSAADALQVGKIKNKVLKLTGEVFVLNIKAAQGQDVADDLATEQTKLTKDIGVDQTNDGAASQSVVFTADDPSN